MSEVLIACTDDAEALNKLVETTIRSMGVEKAVVFLPFDNGYRSVAIQGYSRKQVKLLQKRFIAAHNKEISAIVAAKISKLYSNASGLLADELDLCQMILCPLQSEDGVLFGIYVIGFSEKKKNLFRLFNSADVEFFETVAKLASAAIIRFKLIENLIDQQRLETQLTTAAKIQSLFWPEIPDLGGGSYVRAKSVQASFVGGDLYDFLPLNDGSWIFYVADVSDKGLPAAMVMVALWSKIRSEVYLTRDIEKILETVNDAMYDLLAKEGFFATIILGKYWPDEGRLSLVRGGHIYPLLISKGQLKKTPKLKGVALGIVKNAQFHQKEIVLSPGESVIFLSDGVTEAENEQCELFGDQRLAEHIEQLPSPPWSGVISDAVKGWQGEAKPNDDLTILEIWRDDVA